MVRTVVAQIKVKGVVYDNTGYTPMSFVSVSSISGKGTSTDLNGNYELDVAEKDSIWFSYLGKSTIKFNVLDIDDPLHFDISIFVRITVLKEVKVKPPNYREDSLQYRLEYAKGFNYRKPTFGSVVTSISITGFSVDIDELIRVFQYRKKHNSLKFQERLLQQERDKFIDNRFSKRLVLQLTGLANAERDSFMVKYRPTYYFTLTSSDYDFYLYIKNSFMEFIQYSTLMKIN